MDKFPDRDERAFQKECDLYDHIIHAMDKWKLKNPNSDGTEPEYVQLKILLDGNVERMHSAKQRMQQVRDANQRLEKAAEETESKSCAGTFQFALVCINFVYRH